MHTRVQLQQRRPALLPLIALLLLAASFPCFAAAASADSEETATITGVVLDADGQPAAGAKVTAVYWGGPNATIVTDSEGRFTLDLATKQLTSKRGLLTALLVAGKDGGLGYGRPSTDPKLKNQPLKIKLSSPRTLDIEVHNADRMPQADVEVIVRSEYATIARGRTDGQGKAALLVPAEAPLQFVMAWNKHGIDYALFRRANEPANRQASDPYRLAPNHQGPITLTLSPTRSIKVRVVDNRNLPLASVNVQPLAYRLPKHGGGRDKASLHELFAAKTDKQGIATIDSIPVNNEGDVPLKVEKEGYVVAERAYYDPKKPQAEYVVRLLPLVPVRGSVVDSDGAPAAGVKVQAIGDGYTTEVFGDATFTDAQGEFRFNVNPNLYYYFAASDERAFSPISARVILDEPPEKLQLKLQRGTRVFGHVTSGQDRRSLARQMVIFDRYLAKSYDHLPEEQQLPNPSKSRSVIAPRLMVHAQTDAQGRYELFTGPGEHSLFSPPSQEPAKFTVPKGGATEAIELNIHNAQRVLNKITGRVFSRIDLQEGVAEVSVLSYPLVSSGGRHFYAKTDADGKYAIDSSDSGQLVGAFSKDRRLGVIYQLDAETETANFILLPIASVVGRLVDPQTGQPKANQEIIASLAIKYRDGTSTRAFARKGTTGAAGRFKISGLVPGYEYQLELVTKRNEHGFVADTNELDTFKLVNSQEFDLGEVGVKLPPPR